MKSIPTQSDMESEWCRRWLSRMKLAEEGSPIRYHRKSWEVAWMMENMERKGLTGPKLKGLGFGVGLDYVAPLLVGFGHDIILTDAEPSTDQIRQDWLETGQHCGGDLSLLNIKQVVTSEQFQELAKFQYLDMNGSFDGFTGFDYCWSLNSMDHLGSIDLAHSFLIRSIDTLKPGGFAIHTTELNVTPEGGKSGTYTSEKTVFMLPNHLHDLVGKLQAAGHIVDPVDITSGTLPLDSYVDRPPFIPDNNGSKNPHLKMENNEWVITSVGLVIQKKHEQP